MKRVWLIALSFFVLLVPYCSVSLPKHIDIHFLIDPEELRSFLVACKTASIKKIRETNDADDSVFEIMWELTNLGIYIWDEKREGSILPDPELEIRVECRRAAVRPQIGMCFTVGNTDIVEEQIVFRDPRAKRDILRLEYSRPYFSEFAGNRETVILHELFKILKWPKPSAPYSVPDRTRIYERIDAEQGPLSHDQLVVILNEEYERAIADSKSGHDSTRPYDGNEYIVKVHQISESD